MMEISLSPSLSSSHSSSPPRDDANKSTHIPRPDDYDSTLKDWVDPHFTNPPTSQQSSRKRKEIFMEERDKEEENSSDNHDIPNLEDFKIKERS